MNCLSTNAFQILNTLTSINEKYALMEKNPRIYGKDIKVYPSQIRAIVMVGHNPGINITELAQRLEITKASASELITKLVGNGLVRKTKEAGNNKEVLLFTTDKCQVVLNDLDKQHEQAFHDFKLILSELHETNFEVVVKVLKRIDLYLGKFIKENR